MDKFSLLTKEERIKALERVDRNFDKTYLNKVTFTHAIFKDKFPYEYSNTPIGELTGEAKQLHDYLFNQSLKWISPIQNKMLESISLKLLARRKPANQSTFRKFYNLALTI